MLIQVVQVVIVFNTDTTSWINLHVSSYWETYLKSVHHGGHDRQSLRSLQPFQGVMWPNRMTIFAKSKGHPQESLDQNAFLNA